MDSQTTEPMLCMCRYNLDEICYACWPVYDPCPSLLAKCYHQRPLGLSSQILLRHLPMMTAQSLVMFSFGMLFLIPFLQENFTPKETSKNHTLKLATQTARTWSIHRYQMMKTMMRMWNYCYYYCSRRSKMSHHRSRLLPLRHQ